MTTVITASVHTQDPPSIEKHGIVSVTVDDGITEVLVDGFAVHNGDDAWLRTYALEWARKALEAEQQAPAAQAEQPVDVLNQQPRPRSAGTVDAVSEQPEVERIDEPAIERIGDPPPV